MGLSNLLRQKTLDKGKEFEILQNEENPDEDIMDFLAKNDPETYKYLNERLRPAPQKATSLLPNNEPEQELLENKPEDEIDYDAEIEEVIRPFQLPKPKDDTERIEAAKKASMINGIGTGLGTIVDAFFVGDIPIRKNKTNSGIRSLERYRDLLERDRERKYQHGLRQTTMDIQSLRDDRNFRYKKQQDKLANERYANEQDLANERYETTRTDNLNENKLNRESREKIAKQRATDTRANKILDNKLRKDIIEAQYQKELKIIEAKAKDKAEAAKLTGVFKDVTRDENGNIVIQAEDGTPVPITPEDFISIYQKGTDELLKEKDTYTEGSISPKDYEGSPEAVQAIVTRFAPQFSKAEKFQDIRKGIEENATKQRVARMRSIISDDSIPYETRVFKLSEILSEDPDNDGVSMKELMNQARAIIGEEK